MVSDEDRDLAEAIRLSSEEAAVSAIAAAAAAAATESDPVAAAESVSSRHHRTLLRSFCTLLMEESVLPEELLTEKNSTLQQLVSATESWVDWTAEDERVAAAAVAEAERVASEVAAREAHDRAVAEAVADGVEPPSSPVTDKKKEKVSVPPVTSSEVARQLKDHSGERLVHYLLEECLIRPDPHTHENIALCTTPVARRLCFTLLDVICHKNETNLRVMLDWLQTHHQAAYTPAPVIDGQETSNDDAEEWDIDPTEFQRSGTGFVGLKNQAATCYQNSLFQHLFNTSQFGSELMSLREPAADSNGDADAGGDASSSSSSQTLLARLQTIFYFLSHSSRKYYDPLEFVQTFCGSDGRPLNPREQQDVLEFCNLLFDRLEANIDNAVDVQQPQRKKASSTNLLKKYFRGLFQNELLCEEFATNPTHRRANTEPFYVLSLDIHGCASLRQCLDKFVTGDALDGVHCEACGRKRATVKRCVIHTWPRVVIFHLKRFDFDFDTLKTKKLNDEVSFPLEIDLEPYTEDGMRRRDAQEQANKDAAAAGLTVEEAAQIAQMPHTVTDRDLNIFMSCRQCARQATKHCAECDAVFCPLHDAETHAAIVAPPSDPTKMYRLVGVLVHSGHAEGGHYYSYIRSRTDPNEWHEFNDTAVTPFDVSGLAREAFGGTEDHTEEETNGMETVNHKGKKRGGKKARHDADEWQTATLEKSRNAYLLWYEIIDAPTDDATADNTADSSSSSSPDDDDLPSSLSRLTLSRAASLSSTPLSSLPEFLQPAHRRILRENAAQLRQEVFLESQYLDAVFKVARANIDWLPTTNTNTTSSASALIPSHDRYLDDISAELDVRDLSVLYIQSLTLFVLDTVARVKENHRLGAWCTLLQHAYARHVGCSQWLLERFILAPASLTALLLECPSVDTRKALCSVLLVAAKKLVVFEVDDEFDEAEQIRLTPLKEVSKRRHAQAGLAAVIAEAQQTTPHDDQNANGASTTTRATRAASVSFLSSPLAQSAAVEARLAPEGLFKPTARSTVAVSAKIAVLEGVGQGTQRQLTACGVRTLQELVEMTSSQRAAIENAPTGGMTLTQLDATIEKAQRAIDFILDRSGVHEQVEAERQREAERRASEKAAAGSRLVGPRLLPAFVRTCLQTLERVVATRGQAQHTCPELCSMLAELAQSSPHVARLMIESGAVDTAIDVITSPITTVAEAKAEREKRKQEAAEKNAENNDDDDDDDDENDLDDLCYVEVVRLLFVLFRASTTRFGRAGEPVALRPDAAITPEAMARLQSAPFLTRLVLQASAANPDPPSQLMSYLAWEQRDVSDRILDEILSSVRERDFFDFYAAIKQLQFLLLHVQDSLVAQRVEYVMTRFLALAREMSTYYKATELCIKAFLHLVQHSPAVAAWTKPRIDSCSWMDAWLGKNKTLPSVNRDGTPKLAAGADVARFAVKGEKHEGVNSKWETNWNEQITEYGVGLATSEQTSDYQKIFRKTMLAVRTRK